MLQFLVTSAARRRLLQLLWADEADGSVTDLAERCGVSFASAHRELLAMRRVGLAKTVRKSGRTVYCANGDHGDAELVRQLVSHRQSRKPTTDNEARAVRQRLKALGAPLNEKEAKRSSFDLEATLVDGVKLSRRDATVARTIPLCLWNERDNVSWKQLIDHVHSAEDKHALGFFLELTSELTGDQRFKSCAAMLRDRRVRAQRDFFEGSATSRSRHLAEERTPEVARKWGFRMNMGLDSFRSIFDNFAGTDGFAET